MLSVPQGAAVFTTTSTTGVVTISTNNTEAWASLESDSIDDPSGEPWGPWADADGTMRALWHRSRVGNPADAFLGKFRVHLGDALDPSYADPGDMGIVILQGENGSEVASPFVDKTAILNASSVLATRFDFQGDRVKMKLWAPADPTESTLDEPVAWDIDEAKETDLDIGQVSHFRLVVYGGTTGTPLAISFDTLWGGAGGESTPGGLVILDLPRGDGISVLWNVGPYQPGSVVITVDGLATPITETDPTTGDITFDRAPAVGAWVAGSKANPV
jgi:hypothetical protein